MMIEQKKTARVQMIEERAQLRLELATAKGGYRAHLLERIRRISSCLSCHPGR